ncbi:APC family permease [Nitrospira sp. Kam-Ns4a]
MQIKHWLLGHPLATAQAAEERLSKPVALAVFSSDALSSVAYATEEILLVLVLAGTVALKASIWISLAIVLLLAILTASYRQIIVAYPAGGGAYTVSKANLGVKWSLAAAAALLIDYVLTVAVSVAAGIAAVTSAFPALREHRVGLGVLAILGLTYANLRGVRESGKLFAVPTYLFIGSLGLLLAGGLGRLLFGGELQPAAPAPALAGATEGLTLFLLLRAFSSGCTALTGLEVISNGVAAFRKPAAENAAITMVWMAAILGTLFLGITGLAAAFTILPREDETVVSQLGHAVFGDGPLYYFLQATTLGILFLAANGSFAGFPRLASLLAKDGFLPHQMSELGDKLVFSNGILLLGGFAALLLLLFGGDTHALIPLYAIGVFLSFTLSQAGMVQYWRAAWRFERQRGARKALAINLAGCIATGLATVVIAVTKFVHGAWAVILLIPLLMMMFRTIRRHYVAADWALSLSQYSRLPVPKRTVYVMPISGVNRAVILALDYVLDNVERPDLRAVYVDTDPDATAEVKAQWEKWGRGVPLIVIPSPFREIVVPLLRYIEQVRQENLGGWVTVVLPEVVPGRWWQTLLHNQRALLIKGALLFKYNTIVLDVPYHLD